MDSRIFTLLIMTLFRSGEAVNMATPSQTFEVNPQDTVALNLPCILEYSSFSEYTSSPPYWWKIQGEEETVISIQAQVEEPFLGTMRFSVTPPDSPTRVEIHLQITDVEARDSGIYRCGTSSSYVDHVVNVLDEMTDISIVGGRSSSDPRTWSSGPLTYYYTEENDSSGQGYFQCMATGGTPTPTLQVSLRGNQLTGHMIVGDNVTYVGDTPGLKHPERHSWAYSTDFMLHRDDNDHDVTCVASLPSSGGFPSLTATARVYVHYAPIIECNSEYPAPLNGQNIQIACIVTARPVPNEVMFIADQTSATIRVSEGVDNDHNARAEMVDLGNDQMRVVMTIIRVQSVHYQEHVLRVINSVGETEERFQVIDGDIIISEPLSGDNSKAALVPTLSLLLLSALSRWL